MSEDTSIFKAPTIAWPTLLLVLVLLAAWIGSFVLGALGTISLAASSAVTSILGFWLFVPFHEASHGSVGRSRSINSVVGNVCAAVLLAPFSGWCAVHREHHKHTNDPLLDPDHYAGRGSVWLLPFRWLTLDLYFYFWMRKRESGPAFVLVVAFIALGLIVSGLGLSVLFSWLLPARITTGLVTFFFSYLPHYPHRITTKEDRYRATRIYRMGGLSPLILFQNYHLIHHLYPGVPFYRYRRIFALWLDEL